MANLGRGRPTDRATLPAITSILPSQQYQSDPTQNLEYKTGSVREYPVARRRNPIFTSY